MTTNRPVTRPGTRNAKDAVTPTPSQESAASVASRVAPLDLSALAASVAKVDRPTRTRAGGAGKTARDNSVAEGWVKDLEAERKGEKFSPSARKLPLTVGTLGEVRSRLNVAGAALKAGIGLALEDGRDITALLKALKDNKVNADEKVVLVYWTQTRKQRKAKTVTPVAESAAPSGQVTASA